MPLRAKLQEPPRRRRQRRWRWDLLTKTIFLPGGEGRLSLNQGCLRRLRCDRVEFRVVKKLRHGRQHPEPRWERFVSSWEETLLSGLLKRL